MHLIILINFISLISSSLEGHWVSQNVNSRIEHIVVAKSPESGQFRAEYYGVKFDTDNEKYYYYSKCESIQFSGNNVSFCLLDYKFSKSKILSKDCEKINYLDSSSIPISIQAVQRFRGEFLNDRLKLFRVSDLNDSKGDSITFIRSSSGPTEN